MAAAPQENQVNIITIAEFAATSKNTSNALHLQVVLTNQERNRVLAADRQSFVILNMPQPVPEDLSIFTLRLDEGVCLSLTAKTPVVNVQASAKKAKDKVTEKWTIPSTHILSRQVCTFAPIRVKAEFINNHWILTDEKGNQVAPYLSGLEIPADGFYMVCNMHGYAKDGMSKYALDGNRGAALFKIEPFDVPQEKTRLDRPKSFTIKASDELKARAPGTFVKATALIVHEAEKKFSKKPPFLEYQTLKVSFEGETKPFSIVIFSDDKFIPSNTTTLNIDMGKVNVFQGEINVNVIDITILEPNGATLPPPQRNRVVRTREQMESDETF